MMQSSKPFQEEKNVKMVSEGFEEFYDYLKCRSCQTKVKVIDTANDPDLMEEVDPD